MSHQRVADTSPQEVNYHFSLSLIAINHYFRNSKYHADIDLQDDSFSFDAQKRIVLKPNNAEKRYNIRVEELGKERILPHKMSPWIIENIFKIQRGFLSQKLLQSKKQSHNHSQMLQLKQDLNGLKKDISLLAAAFKNRINK